MHDECKGCKYADSTDIRTHLEKCTYCKRSSDRVEHKETHEDLYEPDTLPSKITFKNLGDC